MQGKNKFIFLAFYFLFALSSNLVAHPKNVIIIRHADKVPNGFCLSLQGLERAAALSYYFSGTPFYNTPPIAHIFAAYRGPPKPYIRCKQTCQPIANHLKLSLNTAFNELQFKEVAREILTNPQYDNKTILICWRHNHIPQLVMALGGEDPGFWADDIYDQVYMLTFEGKRPPKFQKILQKLMFGDRATFQEKPEPLSQIAVLCPDISL